MIPMPTPANPVPPRTRSGGMCALPRRALALAAGALRLAACGGAPQPERPSLVVLLVVDQLRADLLERYDSLFTGGFRRLRDESRIFVNGTHDHATTNTAPGHATI